MAFRNNASFGKRYEYIAVAELLRRGFDVYMTLVDDQGIDCVIRLDDHRYVDVQIKARSDAAKQSSFFAAMSFEPRDNLFFIFYTEKSHSVWVMPSADVAELGSCNVSGKHKGKRHLRLPSIANGCAATRFDKYLGEKGFELLRQYGNSSAKRRAGQRGS